MLCGFAQEAHQLGHLRPVEAGFNVFENARSLRDKGITATDIAKMLGVSRATVYRYLSISDSVSVKVPKSFVELPRAKAAE